jgi:two-component system chemotaxis response regulator CheB
MKRRPTPIVVVAAAGAAADQGRGSIDALRAGALSVVEKPKGVTTAEFNDLASRLCRQIVLMSDVRLVRQRRSEPVPAPSPRATGPSAPAPGVEALGIVASTGGPNAILEILAALGADFPAPIFIVQHITPTFLESFVSWLGESAPMPVVLARHGDDPAPAVAYVAPAEGHLEIVHGRVGISRKPPVSSQRPSGTVLFQSMAKVYGPNAIAVLLTGMGDDGAAGLRAIFDAGGRTIAEDATTAVVYGMPGAAMALGAVEDSLPLPLIAPRLRQLALQPARAAS